MYLQVFFYGQQNHTNTQQTVLSTDKVVENHMIKVTAVFEYRVRREVAPVGSTQLYTLYCLHNDVAVMVTN